MRDTKPCPRCGSGKIRYERWVDIDGLNGKPNTVLYRLICVCGYAVDHWESVPAKAIEHWNTRFVEDKLRARVAELESALAAAREDADRLAAELRLEQNPGCTCEALRMHDALKGGDGKRKCAINVFMMHDS